MISQIFALAILTVTALTPQTLECRGEEPFWHIELNDSSAKLSRPGATEQTFRGAMQRLSDLKPHWLIWRSASAEAGEPLVLILREEACHSTMAEGAAMPYRALLSIRPAEVATGCCKPRADWAGRLPGLLPAVRKCIIDSGLAVHSVAKAWPMNRGMVGVRLIDLQGKRSDCVADSRGKSIASVRKATAQLPSEGNPLFLPAREQPPSVQCGRLERVEVAGVLHGWLNYDPCR